MPKMKVKMELNASPGALPNIDSSISYNAYA